MSGDAERHGAHIDGRRGRSDRQRAPRFHAGRRAIIVGPRRRKLKLSLIHISEPTRHAQISYA
ncbi:hypothetical protein FA542_27070, partial [Pseudomonas aeruginosa]|nr:hypothetical protein [Pseudomonas aeruginosa]